MRRLTRRPAIFALLGLLTSLIIVSVPSAANAAESVPELHWPPATVVNANQYRQMVTSPQGDLTIGCYWASTPQQDLITYDAAGNVVRRIDSRVQVDETTKPNWTQGNTNCITQPVADRKGDVYGVPHSGTKLLAYRSNTLKWKYTVGCVVRPTIGVDGNIYFITANNRIIGLKPDLALGQTQPTKVLDVPSVHGCGSELRAFQGGFVSSFYSNLVYYSANGANLGSPPGNYWQDSRYPINAVGRLFYPNLVTSGSFQSMWLSAYDPVTKTVAYNTQVSTPGANVIENSYSTRPLPNGGVMLTIREQKMLASGVPATPIEYTYSLVVLTAGGQKLWSNQLPTIDAAGYSRTDGPYVTIDAAGRAIVYQGWAKVVNQTTTDPFITVDIIDPTTSYTLSPQRVMRGNTDAASGPVYGFGLQSASDDLTMGANVLYLNIARCTGIQSCNYTTTKLYPFKVPGLGMDYPRSVFLDAPAPTPYAALGDSFSAGEGVPPFEAGTNSSGTNECHRSTAAYPRLISGTSAKIPALVMGGFRACSGAVTSNVADVAQWNEGVQISQSLNKTTKLVTITIGGNDIGFVGFAKSCVIDTCNFSSGAYATTLNAINTTLGGSLTATYKKLLEVTKTSGAKVYVLGYPQVIADKTVNTPGDIRCPYMYESVPVASGRYWEDARAARDIVTKLNKKIDDTVKAVRALSTDNQRLIFVSATATDSPFNTHEVCGSGESYFNNVDQALNGLAYVFHPNANGQAAYGRLARQAIG